MCDSGENIHFGVQLIKAYAKYWIISQRNSAIRQGKSIYQMSYSWGFPLKFRFCNGHEHLAYRIMKIGDLVENHTDSKYYSQFTLGAYPDYEPSSNPSFQWLIVKVYVVITSANKLVLSLCAFFL